MRPRFVCTNVVLLACCLSAASLAAADQSESPLNVVVILADDLGWADLGCYGGDLHETPHLDRLAAEGVRFTDAYAASICSPTRASLMTGKHHARLGITIWREGSLRAPPVERLRPPSSVSDLASSEFTIAEVLHAAGYQTGIVGKWHLGSAENYPEVHGFDTNIGGTLWGAPATYFFPYRGPFNKETRYVPHLEGGTDGEYLTDRLTDEALKFIDRAGDRPFFLYLAHHAPHTPIQAKPELVEHYRQKLGPNHLHGNPVYAAMVHSLDESVGRVVEHLDKLQLADRTLVAFLSDNGGYLRTADTEVTTNYPLRSGKGSLYEGGVRIPLIVRWPGATPAGGVCPEPVTVADLYPTILSATGLTGDAEHNSHIDGRSLAPLLRDPSSRLERDAIYHHYPHYYATTTPAGAIRTRNWKLLEYFEDGRLELYNLSDDPGESQNLANEQPQRRDELHRRLVEWRESVHALLPTANPDWKP
ncbi:MAG: sulfatase [Planctomycetaceae bacterium]|nr:sulfatase [Planctomycetaceae bacterium]